MATEDEIELARKHAYDQGYEHGRDATAGKLISDLVESRDHADDCDCQTCGTRRALPHRCQTVRCFNPHPLQQVYAMLGSVLLSWFKPSQVGLGRLCYKLLSGRWHHRQSS